MRASTLLTCAILVWSVEGSTTKCKVMPFETKDGRTGKCCVVWDEKIEPTEKTLDKIVFVEEEKQESTNELSNNETEITNRNIIDVPKHCPPGQAFDVNGQCIESLD